MTRFAVVGLHLLLCVGCGDGLAPSHEPGAVLAPIPDAQPADTEPWARMPDGFEPVLLPRVTDDCGGPAIWIGPNDTRIAPPRELSEAEARFSVPDVSDVPEGVGREVALFVRPRSFLFAMTGAYNGPGGEPLFRWHVEGSDPRLLMFDRRVSRERFDAAISGAVVDHEAPVRIGGVDDRGGRRCALLVLQEPAGMEAQSANRSYRARVSEGGALTFEGYSLAPGSAPARLPNEPFDGLHIVRVELPPGSPTPAVLGALALGRWRDRRYPWLPTGG